jgi:hypothetical protein
LNKAKLWSLKSKLKNILLDNLRMKELPLLKKQQTGTDKLTRNLEKFFHRTLKLLPLTLLQPQERRRKERA